MAAFLISACGGQGPPDRTAVGAVTVVGTSFQITTTEGAVLRSPDLVGAVLAIKHGTSQIRIRIDAVAPDKRARGQILLHAISMQQPSGTWRPLCKVGPDGGSAFPLKGRSTGDGALHPAIGQELEVVCAASAQGKCARLGYRPWETLADGSPMLRVFNACVRMFRADYGGRGVPTTRDGTLVAVSDKFGINSIRPGEQFEFEAGWDEHGAVCVRHPRIPNYVSLEQIEASSARLKGQIGELCSREKAEVLGALIFNSSKP